MKKILMITILTLFLTLIQCNLSLFKKANDKQNEDLLLAVAANQALTEQYFLKIVSIEPENGTNINSNQSITITFNKEVQQCGLQQEQPTNQPLTSISINGKVVTINPPGGNWGSSGQTLKITGGCSPTDGTANAPISLNYTIN